MAFPHDGNKFQPGQSGNPDGKPKGAIHLSTMIQNMLSDSVDPDDVDPKTKTKTEMQAIIAVAVKESKQGNNKWADWLAKYGYGQKFEVEHSGEIHTGVNDPQLAADFAEFTKQQSRE